MDIGHHGDIHGLFDGGNHDRILRRGHRHTDDLAACRRHPLGLDHVARNILDRDIEHRLHGNGMSAADGNISDLDFSFQLARHNGSSFRKSW